MPHRAAQRRRKPGPRSPKLAFDVKDVAATRDALITRGAKMGKVSSKDGLDFCGGKDPDGNPFGADEPQLGPTAMLIE